MTQGTIKQTVKLWIASVKKMGGSAPGGMIHSASFWARCVMQQKISRKTSRYSAHIYRIASRNTGPDNPPSCRAMA